MTLIGDGDVSQYVNMITRTQGGLQPALAICNLYPIQSEHTIPPAVITIEEYASMLKNYSEEHNLGPIFTDSTTARMLTYRGYYQQIGRKAATHLGHHYDWLVVNCTLLSYAAFGGTSMPCGDRVHIEKFIDPTYFNCFSISLKQTQGDTFIGGISVILHFDMRGDTVQDFTNPFDATTFASGGLIEIKPKDTWTNFRRHPVHVATGAQTDIKIGMHMRKRMESPYGDCTDQVSVNVTFHGFRNTQSCAQKNLLRPV